jgi:ketosteroid isomerase-like protein
MVRNSPSTAKSQFPSEECPPTLWAAKKEMDMEALDARVQELLDREHIRDCLYRYCRGVDRNDEAALRSAYWPDATDRHGVYSGPVEGFFQWALGYRKVMQRSIHQLGNILIEFRPGGAAVESYWSAFQVAPRTLPDGSMSEPETAILAGRYVDWFEKRADEWRIAKRVVVFDRSENEPAPPGTEAERFGPRLPIGGLYPADPVYALLGEA